MKNLIILLTGLLPLFGSQVIRAQVPPDTLYVSVRETSYLLFPEAVTLVDIGRAGEYAAQIEGQSVFLKALHEQAGPTNLLVRYGQQQYFTAKLCFSPQPARSLHDFRKRAPLAGAKPVEAVAGQEVFRTRLARVREMKARKLGRVHQRHHLKAVVTHLLHDEKATYLGLEVTNHSSIDYRPDFIGFSLSEKKGRGFWRKRLPVKELVPFVSELPAVLAAGESSRLFFALPLYAMAEGGKLLIRIREKEGSRTLQLSIPARKINQATRFSHENK